MSPWGKQSGGHFNPAITLAFYRLGKVDPWDVLFYAAGHFLGAIVGVALAVLVLRGASGDGAVRYVLTVPGVYGYTAAFIAELTLSFILMTVLLFVSNHDNLARYTPYVAGALIATYITFEAPLSGMSTNPARTFGSAFYARCWRGIWIYFTAPPLGMLGAAEFFCGLVGVSLLIAQSCTTRRISVVYSTTGLFIRKSRRKSENEKLLLVESIERRPKRLKV
jgi:aquaporin Z